MTDLYQVVSIVGKGLGIVATKFIKRGTLILKEVPQMPNIDQPPPNLQMQADSWIDYIQNVISLFEQMTKSDKEEYFKLHNKYERQHVLQDNFRLNLKIQMLKTIIMMMEAGSTRMEAENILEIIGIYETNGFENGLKLKTSRFNHSCWPNAVQIADTNEIRATYDIKEGQEITINYREGKRFFSMRKRETRQKILLQSMDFVCYCDFCRKQENESTSEVEEELESQIEELIQEAEKLEPVTDIAKNAINPLMSFNLYPPEKCRHEIGLYKELYKLGKKKKAHRTCLYAILNRGYQISSFEYHICYVTTRCQDQCLGYQLLEEFKNECVNFATAAEAFGKLLGNELVMPELWKKRHENFEKYFFEKLSQIENTASDFLRASN